MSQSGSHRLVTIGIPTYNSARFLRQTLHSVADQSYTPIEVIVCDNASSDDTAEIARSYVDKHGFRLHVNETNIGAGENFNKIIELAQGEFVAIYHADDVYARTIVEESVRVLEGDPSIGLVGTMGSVIDANDSRLYDLRLHDDIRRLNTLSYAFPEAVLGAIRNLFVTPSIMVRAQAYRELGVFDQRKYLSACDYEMWLRIARRHRVAVIDRELIGYRIHEGQGSEKEVRKNLEVPDILGVLKEYLQYIEDDAYRRQCARMISRGIFKAAKKQNRAGAFEKSSETLRLLDSPSYLVPRLLYHTLNRMRIAAPKF